MKQDNVVEFGALRIFCAVAQSKTMTQAAERLGITQSAVSQAIKQLESQTETELVQRRSKPLKLTPGGEIMYKYARQLLADTRRMINEIQSASDQGISRLNIGMIDSFGDVASQHIIQQVQPLVSTLSLRTGLSVVLTEALRNHDVDILITSDPADEHPDMTCLPILRDPFVILVPEKYAGSETLSPQWLSDNVPYASYSRDTRIGKTSNLILRRLNIGPVPRYTTDSTQTLLRLIQGDHGWAMAPALCLLRHPELLQGISVLPLAKGANARYLSLRSRPDELGELPQMIADICRKTYSDELLPQLIKIAPWLEQQSYAITELPSI